MSIEVSCPRCGREVRKTGDCPHVRWAPERGGPIEFARRVLEGSPYTQRRGLKPSSVSAKLWETEHDWLLSLIMTRLDVVEGFCFGEPSELDLLCMDIWHRFAPEADRVAIQRT